MEKFYHGLEAKLERHTVTDKDVEQQIEIILEENPKCEHITDRPTQLGDEVVLDYAGFCEGEQFQGGTAEHQHLTLGSGRFIPGFEEQLVGKNIGEEVIVNVTFPEAYHAENLAGKPAEFRCKIHGIHVHSKYELNDEFAKEFGGCENMEEFRKKLAVSMQAYADNKDEMELQDRLLHQAAELFDFTPDEADIEHEIDEQIGALSAELAQRGMNLEIYCQFTGITVEKLREEARESAAAGLRIRETVLKIAETENLTVSEEEKTQALSHVAYQNGMTLEEVKAHYNEELDAALCHSILTGKVMKVIRDNAVVTEGCSHGHCHCGDDHCHHDDEHCHHGDDHCHCHCH